MTGIGEDWEALDDGDDTTFGYTSGVPEMNFMELDFGATGQWVDRVRVKSRTGDHWLITYRANNVTFFVMDINRNVIFQ